MFLFDMVLLACAWGLFQASERMIPSLHTSLSLSVDWATFLLFKPVHLMVSFLCFMTAILIIRSLSIKYLKQLFGKGKIFKVNRIESIALISLSIWIMTIVLLKHFLPAIIFISLIFTFDLFQSIGSMRRKRRLKTAFRQAQS